MIKGATWLQGILLANGVSIDDSQCEFLERYCSLLLGWNKKINLVSRRSEDTIWEDQILHSISFLTRVQLDEFASVIDIGTGGGLPGIPLTILQPGLSMTLLDSIEKKVVAVRSMIQELGIRNIEVVFSRAEDLNRGIEKRRLYDYVVCRGVGKLTDIWKLGYPLLQVIPSSERESEADGLVSPSEKKYIPPGAVLALKGGNLREEVAALRKKKGITITEIDILLKSNETLNNNEKKIVIMRPK